MAESKFVHFEVGGQSFACTDQTIEMFPNAYLNTLYQMEKEKGHGTKENPIQIDRDPKLFYFILEFYRTGTVHLPKECTYEQMNEEMQFYGLLEKVNETEYEVDDIGHALRARSEQNAYPIIEELCNVIATHPALLEAANKGKYQAHLMIPMSQGTEEYFYGVESYSSWLMQILMEAASPKGNWIKYQTPELESIETVEDAAEVLMGSEEANTLLEEMMSNPLFQSPDFQAQIIDLLENDPEMIEPIIESIMPENMEISADIVAQIKSKLMENLTREDPEPQVRMVRRPIHQGTDDNGQMIVDFEEFQVPLQNPRRLQEQNDPMTYMKYTWNGDQDTYSDRMKEYFQKVRVYNRDYYLQRMSQIKEMQASFTFQNAVKLFKPLPDNRYQGQYIPRNVNAEPDEEKIRDTFGKMVHLGYDSYCRYVDQIKGHHSKLTQILEVLTSENNCELLREELKKVGLNIYPNQDSFTNVALYTLHPMNPNLDMATFNSRNFSQQSTKQPITVVGVICAVSWKPEKMEEQVEEEMGDDTKETMNALKKMMPQIMRLTCQNVNTFYPKHVSLIDFEEVYLQGKSSMY